MPFDHQMVTFEEIIKNDFFKWTQLTITLKQQNLYWKSYRLLMDGKEMTHPQNSLKQKKASFQKKDALGWDTRIRTRNDRTRICSVTITPYPNVFLLLQCHFLIASAKVILFSEPTKFFSTFLSKNVIFFIFTPFPSQNTWFCAIPTLKKQKSWRKVTHTHFFALSL